jgi:hypothetical protein
MMPEISTIGSGGDYTTLAAWVSGESGSDYGVGNPAIGEITGTLASGGSIAGVFLRGYILRAKAGEEFDPETLTGAGATAIIRMATTTVGSPCLIRDIIYTGSNTFNVADNVIENCEITASSGEAISATSRKVTVRNLIFTGSPSRCLEASSSNSNVIAENCLSLGVSGSFSFVRWHVTNCLHFGGGSGFAATVAGSDFNASDDTTSPGSNSLDNRTTADLADFAGGDFRTASGSALATAGLGGTFIGFALEVGGGITLTGQTPNYSLSAISATVDLTGSIDITGQTVNYSYSSINASIDLTGEVIVTGSTPNYSYAALAGLIDLTGQISITGATASYNYQSINGVIDLTGEISVLGATPNYSYSALSGNVDLTALIEVVGQTPNYNYNNISGTVELTGEINILGTTPNYSFSAINGFITIGEAQVVGKFTMSYKDNEITASFKSNDIAVKYNIDSITAKFKG